MLRAEREALSCMECNASQSTPHPNFAFRMLFNAQRDELLIQNPAEFVNTLRREAPAISLHSPWPRSKPDFRLPIPNGKA